MCQLPAIRERRTQAVTQVRELMSVMHVTSADDDIGRERPSLTAERVQLMHRGRGGRPRDERRRGGRVMGGKGVVVREEGIPCNREGSTCSLHLPEPEAVAAHPARRLEQASGHVPAVVQVPEEGSRAKVAAGQHPPSMSSDGEGGYVPGRMLCTGAAGGREMGRERYTKRRCKAGVCSYIARMVHGTTHVSSCALHQLISLCTPPASGS